MLKLMFLFIILIAAFVLAVVGAFVIITAGSGTQALSVKDEYSVVKLKGHRDSEKKLLRIGRPFALRIENTAIVDDIINETKASVDKELSQAHKNGRTSYELNITVNNDYVYIGRASNRFDFADHQMKSLASREEVFGMRMVLMSKYMKYLSKHYLVDEVSGWRYDNDYGEIHYITVMLKNNNALSEW